MASRPRTLYEKIWDEHVVARRGGSLAVAEEFLIDAERAARYIVKGLASDRFEITFPKRFTWFLKFMRILPYGVYFRLVGRVAGHHR